MRALHVSEGRYATKEDLAIPLYTPKAIKSCKVMRDLQRLKDGKSLSKGFSFVEFTHHAFALACLRELNNNPAYVDFAASGSGGTAEIPIRGSSRPRLIVEFAIENKRKVMAIESRGKHNKSQASTGENLDVKKDRKRKREASADTVSLATENGEKARVKKSKQDTISKVVLSKDAKRHKIKNRRKQKVEKRLEKKAPTLPISDENRGSTWGGHKRLRALKKKAKNVCIDG